MIKYLVVSLSLIVFLTSISYASASCFFIDEDNDGSRQLCSSVANFNDVEFHEEWIAPLKQFNAGIDTHNIMCNENLVLIQKYDDSPACVTELTKQELIERGWSESNLVKETNDSQPKHNVPEFSSEYEKARSIYLQFRDPLDLPFTGLTTDVNDRNTILLGINSEKLTEEKDQAYYNALVDHLFNVNTDVLITYKNTTGIDFDE